MADKEPSKPARELASQIERDGGQVLALLALNHGRVVTVERQGRSLIYAARYDTMNALIGYLTENCCGGNPALCAPAKRKTDKRSSKPKKETVQ